MQLERTRVRYVFTVRAKNRHGARDLSRRNASPADPRCKIAMPFGQPTLLRTQSPRSYRRSRRDGKHIPRPLLRSSRAVQPNAAGQPVIIGGHPVAGAHFSSPAAGPNPRSERLTTRALAVGRDVVLPHQITETFDQRFAASGTIGVLPAPDAAG